MHALEIGPQIKTCHKYFYIPGTPRVLAIQQNRGRESCLPTAPATCRAAAAAARSTEG